MMLGSSGQFAALGLRLGNEHQKAKHLLVTIFDLANSKDKKELNYSNV
jgi:hypothetical protein